MNIVHRMAANLCLLAGVCVPAVGWTAAPPAPTERITLVCEAVYLPARSTWARTVEIGYDQQRVRSVAIDGVPVYTFAVSDTLILTSQDNERIRIDTAALTWASDFRGLATAQGRCERSSAG
jgi:hypothetical protein